MRPQKFRAPPSKHRPRHPVKLMSELSRCMSRPWLRSGLYRFMKGCIESSCAPSRGNISAAMGCSTSLSRRSAMGSHPIALRNFPGKSVAISATNLSAKVFMKLSSSSKNISQKEGAKSWKLYTPFISSFIKPRSCMSRAGPAGCVKSTRARSGSNHSRRQPASASKSSGYFMDFGYSRITCKRLQWFFRKRCHWDASAPEGARAWCSSISHTSAHTSHRLKTRGCSGLRTRSASSWKNAGPTRRSFSRASSPMRSMKPCWMTERKRMRGGTWGYAGGTQSCTRKTAS
mmetsp:Transcript_4782/g.9518  ORF Transcript_4782/g.9518 Transcript_4782/m.9518 type:complete len:288 (-) Transcript_4782:199-1062(-)